MNVIHSIQWGDAPTWGLFLGTVVTAIFAIRAFRKQSDEVLLIKEEVTDQKELIQQQGELLRLHSDRLDVERQQLEERRFAPRASAWEAATRELYAYMGAERRFYWTVCDYFPLGEKDPPDLMSLIDDRDRFRSQTMHLLEALGLVPKDIAKIVLPVTIRTVAAESEIGAILMGMLEVNQAGLDEGRSTWGWDDVQRVHEASDDSERSQDWVNIVRGRSCHAAEEAWEQVVSDLEDHLHKLAGPDSQPSTLTENGGA